MAIFECAAILFDLDGTLVDSLYVVDDSWTAWLKANGYNPDEYLHRVHGRRSLDTFKILFPEVDAERENLVLRKLECELSANVKPMPGAMDFLAKLRPEQWAIVTSGTSDVAQSRIVASGIPQPKIAVYGEDVVEGKPSPEPFLRAAELLGVDPNDCVVFEDTLAGIRGGHAAGARVIGVGEGPEADGRIPHYLGVGLEVTDRIRIEV